MDMFETLPIEIANLIFNQINDVELLFEMMTLNKKYFSIFMYIFQKKFKQSIKYMDDVYSLICEPEGRTLMKCEKALQIMFMFKLSHISASLITMLGLNTGEYFSLNHRILCFYDILNVSKLKNKEIISNRLYEYEIFIFKVEEGMVSVNMKWYRLGFYLQEKWINPILDNLLLP